VPWAGRHIADFSAPARAVIEVDGGYITRKRRRADARRGRGCVPALDIACHARSRRSSMMRELPTGLWLRRDGRRSEAYFRGKRAKGGGDMAHLYYACADLRKSCAHAFAARFFAMARVGFAGAWLRV